MAAHNQHISTMRTVASSLFLSLFFLACEEVIDLDLEQVKERIVIEGVVSEKPSVSKVKISFTQSIYVRTQSKSASGAIVTLSDDVGNSEVLIESQPGIYTPTKALGFAKREYRLKVTMGGAEFSAVSRMPDAMTLDSVRAYDPRLHNPFGLNYYLTNRPGVEEYCMIRTFRLNDTKFFWTLYSDKNSDGKQVVLAGPSSLAYNTTIRVELISLDKATYEYFRTLQELVSNDGFEAPDPLQLNEYNPRSNITNDALGYFSAQSQRDYVVSLR